MLLKRSSSLRPVRFPKEAGTEPEIWFTDKEIE
jgi:hypothetical protein